MTSICDSLLEETSILDEQSKTLFDNDFIFRDAFRKNVNGELLSDPSGNMTVTLKYKKQAEEKLFRLYEQFQKTKIMFKNNKPICPLQNITVCPLMKKDMASSMMCQEGLVRKFNDMFKTKSELENVDEETRNLFYITGKEKGSKTNLTIGTDKYYAMKKCLICKGKLAMFYLGGIDKKNPLFNYNPTSKTFMYNYEDNKETYKLFNFAHKCESKGNETHSVFNITKKQIEDVFGNVDKENMFLLIDKNIDITMPQREQILRNFAENVDNYMAPYKSKNPSVHIVLPCNILCSTDSPNVIVLVDLLMFDYHIDNGFLRKKQFLLELRQMIKPLPTLEQLEQDIEMEKDKKK
jgi:hypothetical protein